MKANIAHDLCEALARTLYRTLSKNPEHGETLGAFCRELACLPTYLPYQPAQSPRVRALADSAAAASQADDGDDGVLAAAARSAFGWATWTEYYAEDGWSRPFLHLFANGDIVGPEATWRHDSLIVGLFLFGPNLHYPAHAHAADEIYMPLSGAPRFAVGLDAPFIHKTPGDVIVHPGQTPHAICTGAQPAFGVYAWRGAIAEPAWNRAPMGDAGAPKHFPMIIRR